MGASGVSSRERSSSSSGLEKKAPVRKRSLRPERDLGVTERRGAARRRARARMAGLDARDRPRGKARIRTTDRCSHLRPRARSVCSFSLLSPSPRVGASCPWASANGATRSGSPRTRAEGSESERGRGADEERRAEGPARALGYVTGPERLNARRHARSAT